MVSAVDRVRKALDFWDADEDAREELVRSMILAAAVRVLLAEIDAGHWVDAREVAALAEHADPNGLRYASLEYDPDDSLPWWCHAADRAGKWGATAADAVRAAREAANA